MTPILTLIEEIKALREELKRLWIVIKSLKETYSTSWATTKEWCEISSTTDMIIWYNSDKWEVIANLMLSYRHLEDSIMRLWKVLQADSWGENIYDKPPVQEKIEWTCGFIRIEAWEEISLCKSSLNFETEWPWLDSFINKLK